MNGWSTYWAWWAAAAFVTFIVPETIALLLRQPQNTLSAQVWNLEQLQDGQPIWQWTAAHVLIGGALTLVLLWLLGHFAWGLWR